MPIPYAEPALTVEQWAALTKDPSRRRGAACFGALAAHFGTTSPRRLEQRIDKKFYVTQHEERTGTGKYRAWFRDGVRPSDETAALVAQRTAGSVDLVFWRDHPLWRLLAPKPPSLDELDDILEAMPRPISGILFGDSVEWRRPRFVHHPLERDQVLAIRNVASLDAFICLLCLACKGDLNNHDPSHFVPSRSALDLFPRIVHRYPALQFQWEALFEALARVYWRRAYGSGARYPCDIDVVAANLNALQTGRPEAMTLYSGRRTRRSLVGGQLVMTSDEEISPQPTNV